MSGIAGIIRFDGAPVEPGLVEKMTAAMAHRGPDGIHHWVKGSVALGQCMLRTTPESLEEKQPLSNENESLVLVMDGRVDNWEELRRELLGRGAVLRDRSDAELVLRAYEVWGGDCLPHIDGDFALVIWDARNKTAFCARDRLGNKPFNYHWDGKTFAFASELHPILALPWVEEVPNEGLIAEFLAWDWYSHDETLWQGITRLVAAHRMDVDAKGPRPEQYWAPDLWATRPCSKDEDYIEGYRELFLDSVRRVSRSHRPLACEVSGGLDSSAVFCVAEHLRRSGRLPAPGIEGYTLAFTDDSDANELAYARSVGEHLGVRIHEIPPSLLPLEWYEERARVDREFPGYPNGVMSMDLMRQASELGSRVLMTGEWGDAWLQGSRLYYAEELAQFNGRALYDCIRRDTSAAGAGQAAKWFLRYGLYPLLPEAAQQHLRRLARKLKGAAAQDDEYWLAPAMRQRIEVRRDAAPLASDKPVCRASQRDLLDMLYCPFGSRIMDRLENRGARIGMEMRHPFSDHRLVQFAFSTPERLRLRGDRTKYLHVRAMSGLMPRTVLERRTKAEFSSMFRAHLDRLERPLMEAIPARHPDWLAQDGMARYFRFCRDNAQIGKPAWVLWGIYGCDAFFRKNMI